MRNIMLSILVLLSCSIYAGAQTITTIAGNGTAGYTGDGSAATAAELNYPTGVIYDRFGNMYIADPGNNVVRKVNTTNIISTFAGIGAAGYSGDGSAATAAALNYPNALAIDSSGNVYISDGGNAVVRKVNTTGIIATVAGNGIAGFSGDSGPATSAELGGSSGLAVDGAGNLYITDPENNVIRKVNTSGIISTFAGTPGTDGYSGDGGLAVGAELGVPGGVAVDGSGNVYINDEEKNVVRRVVSGYISTFAGNGTPGYTGDGGAASAAELDKPYGVAVDGCGNVYISVFEGIRKVNNSGTISTYVTGTSTAASGLFANASGEVFVPDPDNNTISKISNPLLSTTISGSTTICSGSAPAISVSGGVSGSWATLSPGAATISIGGGGTGSTSVSPSDTTIYTATITGADGCTYPALGTVTIDVPTVAAITGTTSVCAGATTTLSDATPGGTWSSGSASIATVNSSTGLVTGVASGSATITYTFIAGGCTVYATATVTVNPISAITGTTTLCANATTTLSDATGGGSWSSSNTSLATVDASTGVVSGVASGTPVISYTISSTGCYATASVTVNPIAAITGTTTVCVGSTTTLSDATTGGTWSSSNTSLATVGSGTGVVHGVASGSPTISYTITATGCLATATVTVNPLPNAGTITGTDSACDHSSVTLTDAASGGTWSSETLSKATVNSYGVVFAVGVGTTLISYTVTNSCGTAYTTFSFTAKGLASTSCCSPEVCTGRTHTVTGSPSTGTWSWSSPTHCTVSSSGDIATVTGLSTTGTDHIYFSVAASSTYCASIDTQVVIVVAAPTASVTGTTSEYVDSNTTLTGTGSGGYSNTWSSSNTSIATVSSSGVVHGVSAGTDTIYFQSCTSNCCTTDTVTFTVNAHRGIAPNNFPGTAQNETAEIKVYPNPTSGIFTIELPEKTDNTIITLTDIVGKLIETQTTNDNKINIDISNCPRGIYLLKVISGDRKYIEKVVFD